MARAELHEERGNAMDHRGRLDLIRRVQLALAVARDALDAAREDWWLADSRSGASRSSPSAMPEVRPLVLAKVVAEATMLLRSAWGVAPELASALDDLARRLRPLAGGSDLLARLCREPGLALDHAAAHIHLAALGYPDVQVDCLLRDIARDDSVPRAEHLPFRHLEFEWLGQIWHGSSDGPSSSLLNRTCLAHPIDVLGGETTDLYIFTHAILHASDMGRRLAPWPRSAANIAADAEVGLAAALDADNYDLAAELLWTWPMIGLPWSPTAAFGFEILAASQDAHGFLPGPGWSREATAGLAASAAERYRLRTSYHANFVMGFLCAAALRQGVFPTAVALPARRRGRFVDMMRFARMEGHSPTWHTAIAELEPSRQEALVELVLTTSMRRASRAHDLGRVERCLAWWLEHELPEGPAIRQGLGLLRRATLIATLSESPGSNGVTSGAVGRCRNEMTEHTLPSRARERYTPATCPRRPERRSPHELGERSRR